MMNTEQQSNNNIEHFGIRPDYQANPRQVYDTSQLYWTDARIRNAHFYQLSVYKYAAKLARKLGATSLVDVGCGVGTKLAMIHNLLPDLKIYGYDQDEGVNYCNSNHPFGTWRVVDLEKPDLSIAEKGRVVICADVIEHIENPDLLLSFLKECVEPGGRIIISTPDRDVVREPGNLQSPNKAHIREWTRDELKGYLESRGLNVVNQFRMMSVSLSAGRLVMEECIRPLLKGRSPFANQVCEVAV